MSRMNWVVIVALVSTGALLGKQVQASPASAPNDANVASVDHLEGEMDCEDVYDQWYACTDFCSDLTEACKQGDEYSYEECLDMQGDCIDECVCIVMIDSPFDGAWDCFEWGEQGGLYDYYADVVCQ